MPEPIVLSFLYERTTKNTHRFVELTSQGTPYDDLRDATVGALYLKKRIIGDTAPRALRLTIDIQE